jgi:hypothetical protein
MGTRFTRVWDQAMKRCRPKCRGTKTETRVFDIVRGAAMSVRQFTLVEHRARLLRRWHRREDELAADQPEQEKAYFGDGGC